MAINPMSAPIDYLGQMGLTPTDPGTALVEGLKIGEAFRQRRQAREQEQLAEQFNAAASEFYRNPTLEGARNLQASFPEYAAQFQGMTKDLTAEQRMNEATMGAQVLSAIRAGKTDVAKNKLSQLSQAAREQGDESGVWDQFADFADQDASTAYAYGLATLAAAYPAEMKVIGESWKDLGVGRAGQAFSVLSNQQASELGLPELSEGQAYILDEKGMPKTIGNPTAGVDASNVQSSQILEDGTTVSILKNGERVVRNAMGDIVTGQDAADAITTAQDRGAELQGIREGERRGAAFSQRRADAAFGRLEDIRGNIADLQEVNRLIDEGADTGVIASKLPSWRASTIALKTARNRLGLNVVGSVTFGSLTKEELDLALETALPTNLDDADLKDWVNRKIAAQEKLADYLEQQVVFLSEPGNSQADWLKFIEEKGAQGEAGAPPEAPSGFKIIRAE